jgi:hypothetical protein
MAGRDPKYGREHQKLRERLEREVRLGLHSCARCDEPILPTDAWHLDHTDDGAAYLGASHARCNVSEANRLRAAHARAWRESNMVNSPLSAVPEFRTPDGGIVRPWSWCWAPGTPDVCCAECRKAGRWLCSPAAANGGSPASHRKLEGQTRRSNEEEK